MQYELTYEEVRVVCPDFWLGEGEYEIIKIKIFFNETLQHQPRI